MCCDESLRAQHMLQTWTPMEQVVKWQVSSFIHTGVWPHFNLRRLFLQLNARFWVTNKSIHLDECGTDKPSTQPAFSKFSVFPIQLSWNPAPAECGSLFHEFTGSLLNPFDGSQDFSHWYHGVPPKDAPWKPPIGCQTSRTSSPGQVVT